VKSCPKCQRTFQNDAGFCPNDGTSLVFTSLVPIAPGGDDPRIGARLCARYEIRRVVADGGMGRVYEGVDKQTDTRIAVKVLHDDVARDEVSLERFKRVYQISATLPHDYIVQVLDFQQDPISKVWLLVMEFLDGEELRVVLKRDKFLAPEKLIRMMSQTAFGLDAAHELKLVHRDLKPDNLFLCGTREGDNVKILDFGSVKDKNVEAKKLTVLGTTIGSPYYMAPEQAQGLESLDARADVFALAAITYEAITGSVPFGGHNGPSILLAILTQDALPPTIKGKDAPNPIPPAMDDVLDLALAKNPAHRTPSVGAFADALGHAYGLAGDHRAWASTPQDVLARQILEARPRAMAAKAPAFEASADPFASAAQPAGAGGAAVGAAAVGAPYAPHAAAMAMDQAFSATREAAMMDEPSGLPMRQQPPWLVGAIVAGVALLVGIVVLALLLK
jgi:serine/threonine-protein kinase